MGQYLFIIDCLKNISIIIFYRVLFHIYFICHHSLKNKRYNKENTITERNTNCKATIDILLKKNDKNTRKNDPYLKLSPPLNAVIKIVWNHNHPIISCDAMKYLRTNSEV